MTEGLKVQKTVLFVGFTLTLQSCWVVLTSEALQSCRVELTSEEIECNSAQKLNVRQTSPNWKNKEACQAFANKAGRPANQWNKIKCNPFRGGIRSIQRCSSWCDLLASCFGAEKNYKKEQWIRMCSSKFRKLSRVEVTLSDVTIEVVPCLPFTKHLFIVKATTEHECEMPETPRENCEGTQACQAFISNGNPTFHWNKILCNPAGGDVLSVRPRCSCCNLLASCFGAEKSGEWVHMCPSKFRKLSRTEIKISDVNIEVVPCLPFSKHLFIIKASRDVPCDPLPHIPRPATFYEAMKQFFTLINELDFGKENVSQVAVSAFKTVIQQFKNVSFNYQKMNVSEDQKKENTFFTVLAFEDFFIRFAEEQLLNSTFSEFSADDSHNVDVSVKRAFHQNEREFCFSETKGENFIKIPSANLQNNGSVVLGVAYRNLYELLTTNHSVDNKTSRFVSFRKQCHQHLTLITIPTRMMTMTMTTMMMMLGDTANN